MSEQQKSIAAKLVKVMQACAYVQKDAENKEQKYKYVSAAAVLEKVNPALVENSMVSIPEFTVVSEKEKPTSRGAMWQLITVQCRLTIIDAESGESVTVVSLGTGTDPGDKATSKAQTAALKYAWLTALNIETGDDPSADPRTDREQFGPQISQGAPSLVPPGIPDNVITRDICHYWQQLNWSLNSLQGYLEERFHKPVNQITEPELRVVSDEALQYCNQMGR